MKEEVYSVGDKVKIANTVYVIGALGGSMVTLISLLDGNRWSSAFKIIDSYNISSEELSCAVNRGASSDGYQITKLSAIETAEYLIGDKIIQKPKPKFYKYGQRFNHATNEEYMLVCVGNMQACLVSLIDGNRWHDPVQVNSNTLLDEESFIKVVGEWNFDDFTAIS